MTKTPRFVESLMDDYIGETSEEYSANLKTVMERASVFLQELNSDIDLARNLVRSLDSDSARRMYVRTVPAFVEGSLNFLRVAPWGFPPLTSRIPEKYIVNFSEAMLEFKNRSSIKDSIKFTLLGFSYISEVEFSENLMGERGAQDLLHAFQLRDHVMHPRSPKAFSISAEQIARVEGGLVWYMTKFQQLVDPLPTIARGWYNDDP